VTPRRTAAFRTERRERLVWPWRAAPRPAAFRRRVRDGGIAPRLRPAARAVGLLAIGLALLITGVAVAAGGARDAAVSDGEQRPKAPTFSTQTELVRVDVLVTRRGEPVTGLTAADFELLDAGRQQAIHLIEERDAPVDVILALDVSSSMKGGPLDHLVQGVRALLDRLRPGDRLAVVTFSHLIQVPIPLTADPARIRELLSALVADGATAVNDGAYVALLTGDPGVRTLVIVFTDGLDVSSWLTPAQTLEAARRVDAVVYGIMFTATPLDGRGFRDAAIQLLPRETGGRMLIAPNTGRLASVFGDVLAEFRQHYILAFEPVQPTAPGWHPLTIRTRRPKGAEISARAGYFSTPR
jgi:VWFA-related protein